VTQTSEKEDEPEFHAPVMVDEVLEYLAVASGRLHVDGTVGGGGHAEAILEASSPEGRLVGIDRDPEAVEASRRRLEHFGDRVEIVRGNYSNAGRLVDEHLDGSPDIDSLLIDAGVSSHQLDTARRGFSLQREGPLDMRMGPEAERLETYLGRTRPDALADVLREYGDVSSAHRIARAILEAFERGRLETTTDLTDVVDDVSGHARTGTRTATLVFQALRIELNRELEHLRRAVISVPDWVRPGGRAVFISFHSHEDRIVKHGCRELANDCVCPPDLPVCGCDAEARIEVLTRSAVRPSEQEVERNPRARSARLRAVEVK
jgi:16S rRNA (cytosine1402-N4)-methyltransferase